MSWIENNVKKELSSFLFNIKVDLPNHNRVIQRDCRPDLPIDFELLEEQLMETPEMLAFYDVVLAHQKVNVETLERRVEYLKGVITRRLLKEAQAQKVNIRREDLKDLIEAEEEINQTKARLILERCRENVLRAVVGSLKAKSENLRSLAGFKREEKRSP